MAAIRIYRRLQDLQDVDPNGLPDQGVPKYDTNVSSFVVQALATAGAFSMGVTDSGNSAGSTGVTGPRIGLVGLGNITLSQSTDVNGGTITISGAGGGAGGGIALSASDTLFTSGTVVLTGAGGGATVNTVAPGTVQISVAAPVAQTVQTQNRFNLTLDGNTAGALAEVSSGTLTLAGGNGITLSQAGNAITISGSTFSQSVQPETQTFLGGVAASNTTYTSGTVSIVGSGIVTVQSGTGQRVIVNASQSVQPETQTFVGGIIASNTTYTSGSIRLTGVGGGVTVSSNTGQRVDISVAAQTGTQFSAGLTNSGNTSGDTGTVGGRLLLVGTNNITLSGSTNGASMTITMSGPSVAGAQTGISGIAASNTTYTSGTVTFTGVGGGITVSSNTGQRIDLSVAAQTVQSLGMYAVQNTTGQSSSTTMDARTLSVAGDGIVSVGYSAGSLRISASQSVQAETQTFVGGIANSQTTYTSGTVGLSELGAITIRSTTGNQFQLSVNAQTGTQFSAGISGGNTSGDTGTVAGRLVLAGGNNITLSGSTNGASQTITISAGAGGGFSGGVSNIGNTSGDTGITGSRLVFSGAQSITLSQSTNASGATIAISGASTSQSVQTQDVLSAGVSTGGNTAGNTTVNTGSRLVLVGSGMITASQGTAAGASTITLNATQSVQTQGVLSIGASTGGNTAGNTTVNTGSRMVFVGSNLLSISEGTAAGASTLTFDVSNQNLSIGVSTGGNTSGNTTVNTGSRLVLVGSNGITASQGTAAGATTITLSGRDAYSAGMSTGGNTAGDTGYASQRLNLHGGNNITLSGSTNGGSMTISLIGPSPGAAQFSVGVSNLGNTAGSTGVTGTRIVFAGTNNITLSQSTDATGATISINNTVSAFQAGVSTDGNTAGATGVTGTRLVLVGSSPISLSQTTGANGGTVTINAPATSSLVGTNGISVSTNGSTISVMPITQTSFAPYDEAPIVTGQQGQGTLHFMPMALPNIQFDRIALGVQISNASNSSNSFTVSQWVGIYTKNASTLSLVASTSGNTNFSGSGTVGSYSLYAGPKHMTIPWTTTLTASDYYVGIIMRTTTGGGAGHSVSQLLQSKFTNSAWSGILGAGSNATDQRLLGQGVWTVSTSGIPNSVAFTDINGSGSLVLRSPIWHLRSGTV